MTEADVARIESALGHSLPADYRAFLIRHADELRRMDELRTLRAVIHYDPDEIIGDNNFAHRRGAGVFQLGPERRPWPENYLIVGTNGGGDYWFIHRDGFDPGVWFWSHDSLEVERHSASLADYMDETRQAMPSPELQAEIAALERQLDQLVRGVVAEPGGAPDGHSK